MLIRPESGKPSTADELLPAALMRRLERLDIRSTKLFPGKLQGERRSKRRGQSVEFDDFRRYTPGDDPRFIDWNAYARFGKLFLKLFLEEEDLAVHVVLDASASMDAGLPNKLGFAARLAASIGHIALAKQNRLSVTIFGHPGMTRPAQLPERRGRHHTTRLLRFLMDEALPMAERGSRSGPESGPTGPDAEFEPTVRAIGAGGRTKGVVVILSDFLFAEGYAGGLTALAAAGSSFDVYAVQTLAPAELDPRAELGADGGLGGDLRLTDIETGGTAEVTVSADLIRAYRRRVDAYLNDLSSYCLARGMRHIVATSDTTIESLLLGTLRKAGAVG
ncbi:MAG: DUF58 domain-containing protein [Planctomycetota bacterium]